MNLPGAFEEKMKELLGDDFQTDTASSVPYNLMRQTLSTYSYPVLNTITHYGDWQADFQVGALVYYEKYIDAKGIISYGFYGANVDSTLKDDPELTVLGDGYGVVYLSGESNLPDNISVTIKGQERNIAITGSLYYPVSDGTNNYSIYPFPKELVNTEEPSEKFYLKAEIRPNGASEADYYYFNPHFAKSVVYLTDANAAMPVLNYDSNIAIRTARHLYMLSVHYETYATVTAPCTYLQERNIAYTSYDWAEFSLRKARVSSQFPIAGEETAFKAIYDGQCNWITDVSFTTDNGLYVGFIGHNEGTLKNIVLRASYEEGSDNNYYVGRSGDIQNNQSVYMGVLTGKNESTGRISNCAVAGYYIAGSDGTIRAYQNSYLYAGGLVGTNAGNISSSAADTPTLRLSSTYANVAVGNNAGVINNCYALGNIEAFARGGSVSIAGFAGKNSAVLRNSYCATALTASGETTTAYGFAPAGSASNCRYLNNGTYSYVNHMHSFNFDKGVGTSTLFSDLKVAAGSLQAAKNSYDFNNTQTNSKHYPFRAVVKDADGHLVHFGDWLDDENMGNVGIFYWEKETNGSNNGYHFTYLGTVDGEAVGGTSLCTAHDDGGVISEYGYGYFELNKGSVTALQVSGAKINGSSTFDSKSGAYNETASRALEEQMNLTLADGTRANYYFYAFTTRTEAEAEAAKSVEDNGNYVCLSGTDPNSKWTLEYKSATDGAQTKYTFDVSPFFANAMSMEGGKTITATDGTRSDYSKTPGTEGNQYEVRNIQQLQYINWNAEKKNAHTVISGSETPNSRLYDNVKYNEFPYLIYVKGNNAYASPAHNAYWSQSHDMGNQAFNFTPIGCLYDTNGDSAAANCFIAYFGGSYLGNAYRIKNIDISSNATCVGLFGITVNARLEGIVLCSDNNNFIRMEADGTNWYNLGGLVGYAADGAVNTDINKVQIKNCSVSGYRIIDLRKNEGGWGGANVGGLIGASNTNISRCSAVNIIEEDCTFGGQWQNVRVGGLVGSLRGTVDHCYAGGKIIRNKPDNSNGYANIWIGGLTGGIVMKYGGNLNNLIGSVTKDVIVKNSYSYVQLPAKNKQIKSVLSLASNGEMQSKEFGEVDNANVEIINCYCYEPAALNSYDYQNAPSDYNKRVDYAEEGRSGARIYITNNGNNPYLTYDEMDITSASSKLFKYLNAEYNSGSSPLGYGDVFSNVTTTEGNSDVSIDGKYSYPGNNMALVGKNYPFPAIIQQKDLTFSTATNQKYVYVHYGDWPISGAFWEEGRSSMDVFLDMNMDGVNQGYATKTFYLNPNGEDLGAISSNSFSVDPNIAQIISVEQLTDKRYAVTVMAVNTGTTLVELTGKNAKFTLEVTANIDVTSTPDSITLRVSDSSDLTLVASPVSDSSKNFATSEFTTWTVVADNPSLAHIESVENQKDKYTVKREDMGKISLKVTFSYRYNNPDNTKDPVTFTAETYVDVLQPNTVGLSDGLKYNVAYLDATDNKGKDTSYHVDKPMISGADFFLFTDAKDKTMTINSISIKESENNLVATLDGEKYTTAANGTKDGYYLDLNVESSDELYKYLSGNIYYLTSSDDLNPKENIILKVSVSIEGKTYNLQIKLSEVKTCKELSISYQDNNGNSFAREILSGTRKLPTLDEVLVECTGFVIPSGMTLEGWKDEDGNDYTVGLDYDFTENHSFTAVFRKILVTLDANGGQISYDGKVGQQYSFNLESTQNINLKNYSNNTKRTGYMLLEQNAWKADNGIAYNKFGEINRDNWNRDFTLYAQWKPKETTIKLNVTDTITNDKYYQEIKATYESTTLQEATYTHPIWNGYKLLGWSIDGQIVISVNESGDLELVPNVTGYTDEYGRWIYDQASDYLSVELNAKWIQADKLTLENGKIGEVYSEYIIDNPVSLSDGYDSTSISYGEGWTLEGWYTEKNRATGQKILDAAGKVVSAKEGYSKKLADGSYVLELSEDKTLYGCWEYQGKTRFILTDTLVPGEKYLIVNSKQSGDKNQAFGREGNNRQECEQVKIETDFVAGQFIQRGDMPVRTVFFCTNDYKLHNFVNNPDCYIQADYKSEGYFLGHNMSNSYGATKWNYDGEYLYTQQIDSGNKYGYFYHDGGTSFVVYSKNRQDAGKTYLYQEERYSFAETYEITLKLTDNIVLARGAQVPEEDGNVAFTLPTEIPTRNSEQDQDGKNLVYQFAGWKYGDAIANAGDTVEISGNTVFMAQWKVYKEQTVYVQASSLENNTKYVISAESNGNQIPMKYENKSIIPGNSLDVKQGYYLLSERELIENEGSYITVNSNEYLWEAVKVNSSTKLKNKDLFLSIDKSYIMLSDKGLDCVYNSSNLQLQIGNNNYVKYDGTAFSVGKKDASTIKIFVESTVYIPYENDLSTVNFMMFSEELEETDTEEKEVVSENEESLKDVTKEDGTVVDSIDVIENDKIAPSTPENLEESIETPVTSDVEEQLSSGKGQVQPDSSETIPQTTAQDAILPDEQKDLLPEVEKLSGDDSPENP